MVSRSHNVISRRLEQHGFSLLEILVVLVIMGILVSLVAPTVLNRVGDARLQKVQADLSAIETALSIYHLDNYRYPTSEQGLQALVERPDLDPVPAKWKAGGYLKELPVDPWQRPYLYLYPGERAAEAGQDRADIYSLGADGIDGGEGQDADVGNWREES
jgi:general secretion pathway protein G